MSKNRSGNDLQALWQRAQQSPLVPVIVVLAVALLITVIYPSIWLVGLALVLILALLYPSLSSLLSGGRTQAAPSQSQGQVASLDMGRLQGHYLDLVRRALDTRRRIEDAIGQTSDVGQRRVLTDAVRDLPELTDNIYSLACKAQSVQDGLGGSDPMERLAGEIKRLEVAISNTSDEFQKSQYYASMDGKLQQMQNLTDAMVALRRWDAQVENAVSTLDTLLSQVLRIKSSEVLSYTGATDDLSNSLKREVDSLKAAAEAMDTVYGWQK